MKQSFNFHVHAEIFQSRHGELAVRLPGDFVYGGLGNRRHEEFPDDILRELYGGKHPRHWHEMSIRQLSDGLGWERVALLGYVDGNLNQPAIQLEVDVGLLHARSKSYLGPLLRKSAAA